MNIAERIKQVRKDAKLSQSDFGEKLGVSRSVINNIELDRNKNGIQENIIKLICCVFNVNEEWLKNGKGSKYSLKIKTTLDTLAEEYNMSELEYTILSHYLALDLNQRKAVENFIINLQNNLNIKQQNDDKEETMKYVNAVFEEDGKVKGKSS